MHRLTTTALLAAAAGLAACGSKDSPKADSPKVAQSGAAANSKYDPATRTASVSAKEFAFDAPDTIPAGWTTFRFANAGTTLHHMQLARLDSGKTVADLGAAMKDPNAPPPRWLVLVGGPNAPNPGGQSNGTFNLEPGNYVLLCFVDTPDHVPHAAKGMVRPLTVTAGSGGAEPAADATVTLSDYSFTMAGALTGGHHTIKVVNNGPQPHELELVKFAPGKNTKDLIAWAAKFDGPPPGDAIGGIAGLVPGQSGTFSVDLPPGNYGFICFFPSPDKKLHVEHGMFKEFTIN